MFQEGAERFGEPVGQALHRGCRNEQTAATFESCGEVVFSQERARLLVVLFFAVQHLVIELARLVQALIQATALISVRIEAKLVGSHATHCMVCGTSSQTYVLYAARR